MAKAEVDEENIVVVINKPIKSLFLSIPFFKY